MFWIRGKNKIKTSQILHKCGFFHIKALSLDSCGLPWKSPWWHQLLNWTYFIGITLRSAWHLSCLNWDCFVEQQGQCKDRTGTAVLSAQTRGCWEDFLGSFYSEDPWMAKPSLESPVKSGFILGNYRGFTVISWMVFRVELIASEELRVTHSSMCLTSTLG